MTIKPNTVVKHKAAKPTPKQKTHSTSSTKEQPVCAPSDTIRGNLSTEEVRAAGDGASEGN